MIQKPDGSFQVIDLGAAVKFDEQSGVANEIMGVTPHYSHPDIVAAVAEERGQVEFAYKELHEAYSLLLVLQEYLQVFINHNPSSSEGLQHVMLKLEENLAKAARGEDVKISSLKDFLKPELPARKQKAAVPVVTGKTFSEGRKISLRMRALMAKYESASGAQKQQNAELKPAKPMIVEKGPSVHKKSVKELRSIFEKEKPAVAPAPEQMPIKRDKDEKDPWHRY